MSSVRAEAEGAVAAGRKTAAAMLRAAQRDLQKVFLVFLAGFVATFSALEFAVWPFFRSVTRRRMEGATEQSFDIIAQTPFDVILLQAKIGVAVGLIVAFPVFLYYARDGLRTRGLWPAAPIPRWKIAAIGALASGLFLCGLAYGYLVFFPFMFAFLANNARVAGFSPTYSIVLWAQFIFLLTLSFGFAAQLPLVVTGLSYTGVVPYETFREKWRHAVVGIFAFGALFTPPDPFTQVMWATPMLVLYAVSLYLAKVAVTTKRGRERVDLGVTARRHWNTLAGSAVVGFVAVYGFYARGGVALANGLLADVGSRYRLVAAGGTLGVAPTVEAAVFGGVAAALALVAALAYHVYADLAATVEPDVGDPTALDLHELDADGVRAAPREAFADLTEPEALSLANEALDTGDTEKARAVLDRHDEAVAAAETDDAAGAEAGDGAVTGDVAGDEAGGEADSPLHRAAGTFASELSDGDVAEDEVGGYIDDVAFVVDSLTSRSFRIVGLFALVMAVTFAWLYTGGIGDVYANFLSQLPAQVTPEDLNVVALHPMEVLLFEVKVSMIAGVVAVFPLVAYYAWPVLRDRGVVRRHRGTVFLWVGALLVGLFGGFALGYTTVAPAVISYLVADAVQANMVIAYRITNFFWLIILTTLGIGVLADVPVLMVLLNTAGVPYWTIRERWREVTVGVLAVAALFTPADVMTMLLATVPLMVAYGVGLAVLFALTLGGRRDLAWGSTV